MLGISPKLYAGAVTSITERRTEPLVRAAESGEPARGFGSRAVYARGIAQMMRAGVYRPVHVKTLRSQLLQSKAIAIENDLRGTLRNFGLKTGR